MNSKLKLSIKSNWVSLLQQWLHNHLEIVVVLGALVLSWGSWFYYFTQGHNLAYNDAMSHLDISRRVVDNLTPGVAQLGSVWLPMLHVLMLPTIWIDSFWQTGLSAGIVSMSSYVLIVLAVYKTTYRLTRKLWSSLFASLIIALSTNMLYLQTTALTEPLFLALFAWAMYFLVKWTDKKQVSQLVASAFCVMLASLTRYDGWALVAMASVMLSASILLTERKFHKAEGLGFLFGTLAVFGAILWFGWNWMIFGDPMYFATGEFSAKSQQDLLEEANDLPTKGNIPMTLITYYYAMIGNVGIIILVVGTIGWIVYLIEEKSNQKRIVSTVFLAPLLFNLLALYLGHSVIHVPEIVGQSWFNVRYGVMVLPWLAIFIGYLAGHTHPAVRSVVPIVVGMQIFLFYSSGYIITLDDGLWGSSQKNVKEIGRWINKTASESDGYILVSVASHDAILFSSGLPMDRFIHEGTGEYWREAIVDPEAHAEFVIMRTNDDLDLVSKNVETDPTFFDSYELVYDDEFADIYRRI